MKRIATAMSVFLIAACQPGTNPDPVPAFETMQWVEREPRGTVVGRVVDEKTKLGLPDVYLRINSTPLRGAISDPSGNFRHYDVPLGKHVISVTKDRYAFSGEGPGPVVDILAHGTVQLGDILLTAVSPSPSPSSP